MTNCISSAQTAKFVKSFLHFIKLLGERLGACYFTCQLLTSGTDMVDENYNSDGFKVSSTSNNVQLLDEIIKNDNRISSAEQFMSLGHSYQVDGRNEEAIKSYERAVEIALETDDNDIKAKTYQHLANGYTATSDFKNAIECYQKARKISPGFKAVEVEVQAYQWLGYSYHEAGQYHESIDYYKQALELASQFGYTKREINVYFGLGSAFTHIGDLESSRMYFINALTASKQVNDKDLLKIAHRNLGCTYYKSSMFKAAVESYREVQIITNELKQEKEEADACLTLGDIFQKLKQHEIAIESYQDTISISKNLEHEELQLVATQRLARLYLALASDHCEHCDYDKAIEWYQKALEISEIKPTHHLLHEKALIGLGIAMLYVGDTDTAIRSIEKAQLFSAKKIETGKSPQPHPPVRL